MLAYIIFFYSFTYLFVSQARHFDSFITCIKRWPKVTLATRFVAYLEGNIRTAYIKKYIYNCFERTISYFPETNGV